MTLTKKNILYLANLNPNKFGSMEEHALFLSRELRARGHKCYLGFICEPVPDIRRMFEEAGAEILTVYCGDTPLVGNRTSINLREMIALHRMVIQNRIDLVHINFMAVTNPSLLGVYFTRAKIVYTEHASGKAPSRGLLKNVVSRCIHGVISRRISRYIGVSDFVRDRLKVTHHVSDHKTMTIYNGVNLQRFLPRDRASARNQLGLPQDALIICSVAMLIPEKGIQILLEALAILAKDEEITGWLAVVVGEGWYRLQLEERARHLGVDENVHFIGRRSDVETIIAASNVIIVPSVWDEAFGLIVVEAMASGRPVVAARVGGIPELFADNELGVLVDPGNADEIVNGIKRCVKLNGSLRASSSITEISKFNISVAIKMNVDTYMKVLSPEL